ncbi:beta-ketoacyl-ACP synthase III [Desulfopila sp. IMCC35006]|uniref:beta-ketoacyl-ACP synthase III n=1 Tax=Desulfopila sp. IMCC35006 TaxID=2569542 RepID=UPI0010AB8C03|nr:beta-ketoacyl-ACP synthase III [Desulfopila sp. IMCC35006]TKB26306.1 beta-ketoacyl-ACP synthase III [Desulfopila sp. IMCC35006]
MARIVISGTGVFTPPFSITNEELVLSFNTFVRNFNNENQDEIGAGTCQPLTESSAEFIERASGIKSRFVMDRDGVLDPKIMCPQLPKRSIQDGSLQCEISVAAAKEAMDRAGKKPEDIDAVIVSCSNMERPYPAIAVEVQEALGIAGFAFDMNIACSSATFAIQTAVDSIFRGNARAILMVNPEICSGHLNFRDRDSHFIFGDVCTAVIIEQEEHCSKRDVFEIIGTKLATKYSTNIYNGFGFLNRTAPDQGSEKERLFVQEGRKVFKEVVPFATEIILSHLARHNLAPSDLKRVWLHQANLNMNQLICKKLLGTEITTDVTPTILDTYANTASAGSIICFHKNHDDLKEHDLGVICSFGAGYSVGNIIVRRIVL